MTDINTLQEMSNNRLKQIAKYERQLRSLVPDDPRRAGIYGQLLFAREEGAALQRVISMFPIKELP